MLLEVQLTTAQYRLDNGLAPTRRQAIISTNADPIHWRIYAALGGDDLLSSIGQSMKTCQ